MRIYLLHPNGRYVACETKEGARRLEAQGFRRVSPAEYEAVWAERDRARRVELDDAERLARRRREVSG